MNSTVPVHTSTSFKTWGIVLGCAVVVFITFVSLFIRFRPSTVKEHPSGNFAATIHNKSDRSVTVLTSTGELELAPGDAKSSVMGIGENVITHGRFFDNDRQSLSIRPSVPFDDLYVTDSAFGTSENTGTDVHLVNKSPDAVIFVVVSKHDNRRFPSRIVRSLGSETYGAIVAGQKIQVLRATTREILDEIIVRVAPVGILFSNGNLSVF